MAETVSLAAVISLVDGTTGGLQKTVGISFAGTIAAVANGVLIPASPTSITLPIAAVNFVYIKNNHATNTVTVTWTPNGGASAAVQTLEPGSALILSQAVTAAGITALSLQASGASTPVEYILVG